MADFLYGDHLNSAIVRVIGNAREVLLIVSPFIKLHSRIKDEFLVLKDDPFVQIRLLFGKNKEDKYKSLQEEDFNFFKSFPNIEIRYDERLHAKYYSNESEGILCSMNLYDFSQNNNLEAGVIAKNEKFDQAAFDYFDSIFCNAQLLLQREPTFTKKLLGLKTEYECSKTIVDNISSEFDKINFKIESKSDVTIGFKTNNSNQSTLIQGFCIRTRKQIPLNINKPLCDEALKSWNSFKDPTYPEKYDHFTGEETKGETCFEKPVLRQNWSAFQKALKNK